jgi:hypothetical protein
MRSTTALLFFARHLHGTGSVVVVNMRCEAGGGGVECRRALIHNEGIAYEF